MKNIIIFLFALIFSSAYSKADSVSVAVILKINSEISLLKHQNDSLSKRLSQIEKEDYKSIEVIEKVDDFYDKAWNKLIFFLSIAGGIILFVLPYLLAKNQEEKINLKTQEFEDLTNRKMAELEIKIAQFHNDQFELLKNEIGSTQADLNKNINNKIKYVGAFIFALRGMISESNKSYDLFFKHYIIATEKFIELNKLKDIENMVKGITQRAEICAKRTIKIKEETKTRIDKLIVLLEESYSEPFSDIIEILKSSVEKLSVE